MFWGKDRRLPFALGVCGSLLIIAAAVAWAGAGSELDAGRHRLLAYITGGPRCAVLYAATSTQFHVDPFGGSVLPSSAHDPIRMPGSSRPLVWLAVLSVGVSLCRLRSRYRWIGTVLPMLFISQICSATPPRRMRLIGLRHATSWPSPDERRPALWSSETSGGDAARPGTECLSLRVSCLRLLACPDYECRDDVSRPYVAVEVRGFTGLGKTVCPFVQSACHPAPSQGARWARSPPAGAL
jgi:hypothetical protein